VEILLPGGTPSDRPTDAMHFSSDLGVRMSSRCLGFFPCSWTLASPCKSGRFFEPHNWGIEPSLTQVWCYYAPQSRLSFWYVWLVFVCANFAQFLLLQARIVCTVVTRYKGGAITAPNQPILYRYKSTPLDNQFVQSEPQMADVLLLKMEQWK